MRARAVPVARDRGHRRRHRAHHLQICRASSAGNRAIAGSRAAKPTAGGAGASAGLRAGEGRRRALHPPRRQRPAGRDRASRPPIRPAPRAPSTAAARPRACRARRRRRRADATGDALNPRHRMEPAAPSGICANFTSAGTKTRRDRSTIRVEDVLMRVVTMALSRWEALVAEEAASRHPPDRARVG